MRPCEHLSRRQREATPFRLARHLVYRVLAHTGADLVAVLWVQRGTVYHQLWPACEVWGRSRDAMTYAGPWPVVAHPTCGPWGNYRARSRQPREHGVRAMALVHRFGGVVEQPVGSSLFRDHGGAGRVQRINQSDYGHPSLKPTLLYWSL